MVTASASVTAAAMKFARVRDAAEEYRVSKTTAPVRDVVTTLGDWELKEIAAFEEPADALTCVGFRVRRQP